MKRIKTALVFSAKAIPRAVIIMGEVAVILCVIMALAVTVFLGRLAHSPIDLSFAKKMIAETLSSSERQMAVDVTRAVLSWPDRSGPFQLNLTGLTLIENGQPLATVRTVNLWVDRTPLLWGHIRPKRLIIDSPELGLTRDSQNALHFSLFESAPATLPDQSASQKGTSPNEITENILKRIFQKGGKRNGVLDRIEEIEVRNARLRINDHILGMTWGVPRVNVLFQKVDIGIKGNIGIELAGQKQLMVQVMYQKQRDEFTVTSHVRDFPLFPWAGRIMGASVLRHQHIPLSGELSIRGKLNPFDISVFTLKARAKEGTVDIGDGDHRVMVPIKNVDLDLSYDRVKVGLHVSTFDFDISDVPVTAGFVFSKEDRNDGYQGAIQIKVKELLQDKVVAIWPMKGRDHGLGEWITQKLSGATFKNVVVDVPLSAAWRDHRLDVSVLPPRASWAFTNLRADYLAPLTPVMNGTGTGTFMDDMITVNVDGGQISDLKIAKGTVKLTDVTKAGAGDAHIDMTLTGPISSMLNYIKDEPVALGGKIPVDIATIKGTGTYHAVVSFPTLKNLPKDQVNADVDAVVTDLVLEKIIAGQTVSGGPFTLVGKDGMVTLSGNGKIAGRAVTINWTDPVVQKPGDVCTNGKITLDTDENLRRVVMGDVSFMMGSVPVDIEYRDCFKGAQTAKVKADLTPARILVTSAKYEKPAGKAGGVTLDLTLSQKGRIEGRNITVKAPNISVKQGSFTVSSGKKGAMMVTKATLPDFTFMNSSGVIIYNRYKERMAVDIAGPAFDLAPFLSVQSGAKGTVPLTASIKVDRLGFGGSSVLEKAALRVDFDRNNDLDRMDITGRAGAGDVAIKYLPDTSGRMALNVNAGDAGAFLRALDIYDNVKGGTLNLNATPIGDNNRDVKGMLVLRDFSVVKAPVLAQLLGALSIKGLSDQLNNQGIGFDRLESGFALVRRPGQDIMSFREGRTTGSAIGITFDGVYNRGKGTVDLDGTIIPVAGLNTFTSKIPLIGRLLTGGKDSALFAATYSVKGSASNPKTMINPLAVLTPGILRKILFEDQPDDPLR